MDALRAAGRLKDLEWSDSDVFDLDFDDVRDAVSWVDVNVRAGHPVVINCAQVGKLSNARTPPPSTQHCFVVVINFSFLRKRVHASIIVFAVARVHKCGLDTHTHTHTHKHTHTHTHTHTKCARAHARTHTHTHTHTKHTVHACTF
jgi:hypothetical protein